MIANLKADVSIFKTDVSALKAEVYHNKHTVQRTERVQLVEIEPVVHQESTINKMREACKAV